MWVLADRDQESLWDTLELRVIASCLNWELTFGPVKSTKVFKHSVPSQPYGPLLILFAPFFEEAPISRYWQIKLENRDMVCGSPVYVSEGFSPLFERNSRQLLWGKGVGVRSALWFLLSNNLWLFDHSIKLSHIHPVRTWPVSLLRKYVQPRTLNHLVKCSWSILIIFKVIIEMSAAPTI